MKAYERLIAAIRQDLDPKFQVCRKDSSWIGRVHSWFAPNAAVILGHTCYVPEKVFDSPAGMAHLMAHEGAHVAQRRDLGAFAFNWLYAYPLSMAAVELLIAIALFVVGLWYKSIIVISCAALILVASMIYTLNVKWAKPRAILELEAFATSWWYFYGSSPARDEFLVRSWITGIRQTVSSSTYLWCGLSIGTPLINKVLFDAARGIPSECDRSKRDHTVRWFLTSREILLDERLQQR